MVRLPAEVAVDSAVAADSAVDSVEELLPAAMGRRRPAAMEHRRPAVMVRLALEEEGHRLLATELRPVHPAAMEHRP